MKRAENDKRISPHSLRHSFIPPHSMGIPLRDVQEAASHADPRTTMRYDRARRSLHWHTTYIASTFIAEQHGPPDHQPPQQRAMASNRVGKSEDRLARPHGFAGHREHLAAIN